MKNIILTICLSAYTLLSFGQKSLSDIKFSNSQLEEINPSSFSDIEAAQEIKFKSSNGLNIPMKLISNYKSKPYLLKGSDDLLQLTLIWNSESLEKWDEKVGGMIETFSPTYEDKTYKIERFTEFGDYEGSKFVIFFTKDQKLGNRSYVLYKNSHKKIGFFMIYLSALSDKDKIENMRKVIRNMKFD